MANIPKPSKSKELPEEGLQNVEIPNKTPENKSQPTQTPELTIIPNESPNKEEMPVESAPNTEIPSGKDEENCVVIDGEKIEIKPTKLKYFRNKAASGYGLIKAVPLHELLTYGKGIVDEKRSADELLFDFLVAVFDDSSFVRDHYEDLDADVIDRLVKIFGRINHINEKEEAARKNKEAQEAAKH